MADFSVNIPRFSLALQRGQVEGSEKGPPRERALRRPLHSWGTSISMEVSIGKKTSINGAIHVGKTIINHPLGTGLYHL
jgi:hypothetical protein